MTRNQVSELYEILKAENEGKAAKLNKLAAINKNCENLAKKGIAIEIKNIVNLLLQEGIKMSARSIYNKENGRNPYRRLVDAWSENSIYERANKQSVRNGNETASHEKFVTESDLAKIPDPVLRYKISLLYGEVASLRSQNDMLRNLKDLPSVQMLVTPEISQLEAKSFVLDEYEVDVLESFVSNNSTIDFDDNGRLFAKTTIPRRANLSSEDLKFVLEKVLKSYGRKI